MVKFERTPGGSLTGTLRTISRFIVEGSRNPMVLDVATGIVGVLPDQFEVSPTTRDLAEISAIHAWVIRHIRYTKDVLGEETVRDAEAVLRTRQGDCDCHAVLTGSLLRSIGIPVMIWLSGTDHPSHIYLAAKNGKGWIAVDTTLKTQGIGATTLHPNHWRVENVLG